MAKYETYFIPQNKAPKSSDYINVYNGTNLIGKVKTSGLKMPNLGGLLYKAGALSDVHVTDDHDKAMSKFHKAMSYFNDVEKVAFVGISGDLISGGTSEQFDRWREEAAAEYSNIEATTGNHDVEDSTIAPFLTRESTIPYTGYELYYSFERGNDLHIMFGMSGWPGKTGDIFTTESLQWLYETLEANRNRRVFLWEHCPYMEYANGVCSNSSSGAVEGWPMPTGNHLNQTTAGAVFISLISHYHNVIWIHGHSHMEPQYQEYCSHLNYDNKFGCHSVHIPSSAEGRELSSDGTGFIFTTAESFGYVVDVYENYVVFRGRDFVTDKFIPTATFCLDTSPVEIPEKSYTDSTGTIIT